MTQETVAQRSQLLLEAISTSHHLMHWTYDAEGKLLDTNCKGIALDAIFSAAPCKAAMLAQGAVSDAPMILTIPLGLIWVAVFYRENGKLCRTYVMGPAFHTEISMRGINNALEKLQIPQNWRKEFIQLLHNMPVLPVSSIRQIAIMLHYGVTGQKLTMQDIVSDALPIVSQESSSSSKKDRHRTYLAEQKLLGHVRSGNMDFEDALNEAGAVSTGLQVQVDMPITQAKLSQIVFISLCVRAAIDGGLTPDAAYSLGDGYIQQVNSSQTISQIGSIGQTMYAEFIRQVHKVKQRKGLSRPVRNCCAYIELHPEEPLSMEILSHAAGYTAYYLSRKFHQEMGLSVTQYIRQVRMERACLLLSTTDATIPEISERLQYNNRSYFSIVFKEYMGQTPVEYRKANHKA